MIKINRLFATLLAACGVAAATLPAFAEEDFLHPDEAFRLEAFAEGPGEVQLLWQIADGYYLYRNRLKFKAEGTEAQLGTPVIATGKPHTDEYFGTQEVYYGELDVKLPVVRLGTGELQLPLKVTYQGCADAGLCYPPVTKTLTVSLPPGAVTGVGAEADKGSGTGGIGFISEQDRLAALIREGNLFLVLGTFFGLGLLLAFTPCVLPMVPILSGIIAGSGARVTTRRAFALSLSYVLGMAFTYTVAGLLVAAAGQQVQALFQQTWIVVVFALLFVVMALSMFGLFTVQMPAGIQTRLAALSNRQTAGTFGGVAVMGALSALIVTTCVAPPLVATLAVIGQSADVVRGGLTLFVMSLGMGAPLLVVGASAGKLLPKAGAWMDTVKKFFGVMLLAVAAWMLARVVPERFALLLWAVPVLIAAVLLFQMNTRGHGTRWVARTAGAAAALYGVVLLAGAGLGGSDPLSPLPQLAGEQRELSFRTIKTVHDLQREVREANAMGKGLMLDFYADWCVSCKEMEKYTFTDEAVQTALSNSVLLRADVTRNDAEDQALLKHFGIFGPPTIAFYGPDGMERSNFRVVGFMEAAEFASLSRQALAAR